MTPYNRQHGYCPAALYQQENVTARTVYLALQCRLSFVETGDAWGGRREGNTGLEGGHTVPKAYRRLLCKQGSCCSVLPHLARWGWGTQRLRGQARGRRCTHCGGKLAGLGYA